MEQNENNEIQKISDNNKEENKEENNEENKVVNNEENKDELKEEKREEKIEEKNEEKNEEKIEEKKEEKDEENNEENKEEIKVEKSEENKEEKVEENKEDNKEGNKVEVEETKEDNKVENNEELSKCDTGKSMNDDDISKDFEILSSDSAQYDYNYKIIIIGDSGVGKTCLTYRATSGEYHEKIAATIGFEYFPFVVKYRNKILKLEIWDTCGQEAYRSLIKSFFNNSSLAIIVYAVDNKRSFTSIDEWIRQCRSLCSPDTKFFLIGNKNDIEQDK